MSILLILIPLGLLLTAVALLAFFWAVTHDQFEDLDRAGHSILFDDDVDQNLEDDRRDRSDGEGAES